MCKISLSERVLIKLLSRGAINLSVCFLAFLVTSCGGSSDTEHDTEAVTSDQLSGPSVGSIADYKDADWIRQNYFSENQIGGLNPKYLLPDTRLIANGVALQLARGQSEVDVLRGVHEQLVKLAANAKAAGQAAVVDSNSGKSEFSDAEALEVRGLLDRYQTAAAEAAARIAKKYDLPYHLGISETWWIDFSESTGALALVTKDNAPGTTPQRGWIRSRRFSHPDFAAQPWQHGDIAWANGSWGSALGVPSAIVEHMGLVFEAGGGLRIIDANVANPEEGRLDGVRQQTDLSKWASHYSLVARYAPISRSSVGNSTSYNISSLADPCYSFQPSPFGGPTSCAFSYAPSLIASTRLRLEAVNRALSFDGLPYSTNFTQAELTNKFYCSSLVWRAYKGIDVDSAAWQGGKWISNFDLLLSKPSGGFIPPQTIRTAYNVTAVNASVASGWNSLYMQQTSLGRFFKALETTIIVVGHGMTLLE